MNEVLIRQHARRYCTAALITGFTVLMPLGATRAQAPASHGSLSGFVLDPSGARIPQALVYLRTSEGGIVAIDRADPTGEYAFRRISTGHYQVEARAHGFAPMRMVTVSIDARKPVRADLPLEVGGTFETATVMGTGPGSATTPATERIRVGGNVQPAKLVSKVDPVYPPDAEAAGVEGNVTIRAVISTDGNVLSVTSINNGVDPRLARAAEAALRAWQYKPTLLDGNPVEVTTMISIVFRLKSERQ
jgi:TonB family protein